MVRDGEVCGKIFRGANGLMHGGWQYWYKVSCKEYWHARLKWNGKRKSKLECTLLCKVWGAGAWLLASTKLCICNIVDSHARAIPAPPMRPTNVFMRNYYLGKSTLPNRNDSAIFGGFSESLAIGSLPDSIFYSTVVPQITTPVPIPV